MIFDMAGAHGVSLLAYSLMTNHFRQQAMFYESGMHTYKNDDCGGGADHRPVQRSVSVHLLHKWSSPVAVII
jgi:hypothetical protein